MGGIGSFEFVPTYYKIKYVDSLDPNWETPRDRKAGSSGTKTLKVLMGKGVIEEFTFKPSQSDLTVGWLLSEVSRRYDNLGILEYLKYI